MTLFKGGAILIIASMTGNISNYFFQFFMSRRLSLEDYGAMNAVFSVFVIVGIPATTIMLVVAKYITTFNARGEGGRVSSFYRSTLVRMAVLGMLFFSPFLIFNGPITGYLKIQSGWPLIIIGLGIFFSFIVTVNFGMLQGLKRFYCLGAGMGFGGVFRLLFGCVFILMGYGLNGAVAAVTFSMLTVFIMTSFSLSPHFKKEGAFESRKKDVMLYSVPVLLSTVGFTTMTNMDLIFVKHIFSPDEAGLYAAVSVLGKTILYLPSALVLALFPIVSESHTLNNDTFKILDKGLVYTAAISSAGVLAFVFFPSFAIGTLFGESFVGAAPLLKFYGLAMMSMSFMSILISFNLARGRTGFLYSMGAGCIALFVLINVFHDSMFTVIFMVMTVAVSLTAVNLWMVFQDRREFYRFSPPEMEGVGR